jgi:uncharacterized lipoprotein NlpE involved in copper resistance
MKRTLLFTLLAVVAFAACNNSTETATTKNDSTDTVKDVLLDTLTKDTFKVDGSNAQNSLDVNGKYAGVTPCADCEGIETEIELFDETYNLTRKYLGKQIKKETVIKGGHWKWIDGFTIELTEIKDAPNKFFVGENKLIQLDMEGKKIEGNLATKYELIKK